MTGHRRPRRCSRSWSSSTAIRALAFDLLEQQRSASCCRLRRTTRRRPSARSYDLLVGARRAVLGNPAAARGLYDLLVGEGRRYAATAGGRALRDALAGSAAVDHLRRIWETVSLNVLDGPAPSGVPDAWAELLAEAVTGDGLDDGPGPAAAGGLRLMTHRSARGARRAEPGRRPPGGAGRARPRRSARSPPVRAPSGRPAADGRRLRPPAARDRAASGEAVERARRPATARGVRRRPGRRRR